MHNLWPLTMLLCLCAAMVSAPVTGKDPKTFSSQQPPREVRALEGTYTGSWTMYGIDGQGKVVQRMAWTDVLKAGAAKVDGDRAYVTWTDEQKFTGAKGPPRKMQGKEGYYLTKEGGLGDYFIEMFG